jgi:putative NADH-flavin reductase
MKILVLGATGGTGRLLVSQGLARDFQVTALARDPGKLTATHPRLTALQGDVSDAGAVARAVRGQEAVISALGASSPSRRYPAFTAGIRNLVAAMESGGVSRLIYQSFLGVAGGRRQLRFPFRTVVPLLLPGSIADHEENEARIRSSSLAWTIVRPPKMNDQPARGDARSGEDIRATPLPSIPRADVAAFMLDQLTDPRYVRRAPAILR